MLMSSYSSNRPFELLKIYVTYQLGEFSLARPFHIAAETEPIKQDFRSGLAHHNQDCAELDILEGRFVNRVCSCILLSV